MPPIELAYSSEDARTRTELHEYQDSSGNSPYGKWFAALDPVAAAKVTLALVKVALGNTRKVRSLGSGLAELKVDSGPGYRVYFARESAARIVLLGHGMHRLRSNSIEVTRNRWRDYQLRKRSESCHQTGALKKLYAHAHAEAGLRRALLQETADAFLSGDVDAGKAVLRDYIHATVGFDAVARAMRKSPKSLMRMLSPDGNPQAANLFAIFRFLQAKERIRLAVKAQPLK